jgi:outer membrane protein
VATEQELIYRVAEAYFKVLQTQDNLTFAESQNAAFARQLEQAQQRFDVGLIAVTSVHEAKAAYDQSRSELIKAQYDVDNAWEALYEIINQRPEVLARLKEEIPLDSPEPKNIEQWSEQAQQQNLSIQAANYAAAAARQEIEVQSSGSYPQVSLVGRHDVDRTDREYGSDTDTTMVGLQLELPLYTGGAVEAATRQARYQYQAATEALDGQIVPTLQRSSLYTSLHDAPKGPKARNIPAWGSAPGSGKPGSKGLKARPIGPWDVGEPVGVCAGLDGAGFQPSRLCPLYLGRCPRLVWKRAVGAVQTY